MQITEKCFHESSDSVDAKEAKQGEDIFGDVDGLSNDSSDNITVLNCRKFIVQITGFSSLFLSGEKLLFGRAFWGLRVLMLEDIYVPRLS